MGSESHDWANAPWWAKFRTMDADGTYGYHELEPRAVEDGWISNGRVDYEGTFQLDWKGSLQRRPQ